MTWFQRLIETFDACAGAPQFAVNPLPPISHTPQQAHIEIVIDGEGNFLRARLVEKEETLIPATEASAGRTGTVPAAHPLCDKLQFVAGDYAQRGGKKPPFFDNYYKQLADWCKSENSHPKALSVLKYVRHTSVVSDLINAGLLVVDAHGNLKTGWDGDQKPPIFSYIAGAKGEQDQGAAFVRWVVEIPGDLEAAVWKDASLQKAWADYNASNLKERGLCMATGENKVAMARSHPKRLRHAADGAKLVSSNDAKGFTYRGRFTDDTGDQACGIGFVASQKAHLALRWLIARQSFRNGDQAVVAWSIRGADLPNVLHDTFSAFGFESEEIKSTYSGDAGQRFAIELRQKISGYRAKLNTNVPVVMVALDAATPGRMAIAYYREFTESEFLDRLESWHMNLSWPQDYGQNKRFIGAPSPADIGSAAYGSRMDEKLKRSVVERLLPCIADGRPVPRDLVECTIRRATQRAGLELWEWNRTLGIACALFKGTQLKRKYQMSLEEDRTSRDYLYGRLLALADKVEEYALYLAKEKRDTTAGRLMQRFADHPYSTWRNIELSLPPYKSRIRSRSPRTLEWLNQQIDAVNAKFDTADFVSDRKLSGEFLLGYHCQRAKLRERTENAATESTTADKEISE